MEFKIEKRTLVDIEFNFLFSRYKNRGHSYEKHSFVLIIMKALIPISFSLHRTSPQWHPDASPSVCLWGITIALFWQVNVWSQKGSPRITWKKYQIKASIHTWPQSLSPALLETLVMEKAKQTQNGLTPRDDMERDICLVGPEQPGRHEVSEL